MRALVPGHRYLLDHLDGEGKTILHFVSRPPLNPSIQGVTNQEVLRTVIDRVKHLNSEIPWSGNTEIIHHLRMALALHETRAILRHVEKGHIEPENVKIGDDGHFILIGPDGGFL